MRLAALALLVAFAASLAAPPARASDAGWDALARPGAIAVMRHALAPGTGDPPSFRLGDCSTQRNLDARGREQARAIDAVYTSEWCRCRETAERLALAPVEPLPALNSFFGDRSAGPAQTEALEAFLNDRTGGERIVLVTHQVNVTALTGVYPASGEIVVGRMDDGGFAVEGRIRIGP